jgi:Tol biopolymer transport system component
MKRLIHDSGLQMRPSGVFRGLCFCLVILILAAGCSKKSPTGGGSSSGPVTFENAVQLTDNLNDVRPRWSPQGDRIAFERNGYIYLLDVDTGGLLIMTEGHSPCWSFTGVYLGFVRDSELYKMLAQPGGPVEKLSTSAGVSYVRGCDWGKGDRFVYIQPPDTGRSNSSIIMFQPASGNYTYFQQYAIGSASSPGWSYDGAKVLFNSQSMGPSVLTIENQLVEQVLAWEITGMPCWYNSTQILFTKEGNLYRINVDGTERTLLYKGDFYPKQIDYSPVRGKLAFTAGGIWVMDLEDD